jgi:hypothetical protein
MIKRGKGNSSDDEHLRFNRRSMLGRRAPGGQARRTLGFPAWVTHPLYVWTDDSKLKQHASYRSAKAGNAEAAISLVSDVARPLLQTVIERMDSGELPARVIFVAPHAREASGDNAIPQVLATMFTIAGGEVDEDIVQTTKVYHTGADPMERLNARASFHGRVFRGRDYVLVDDVTTLGGTLCDLADYIRRGGGNVVAAVVLVNASRSGRLYPVQKTVQRLDREFGHVIRETFGIEPSALTADEAQYLLGFRTAEEIRGRSAKAREKTDLRLRAKGVLKPQAGIGRRERSPVKPRKVPFPGASAVSSISYWIPARKKSK